MDVTVPICYDTMVQYYTSHDFHHFANNAVLADDRLLYASFLADLGSMSHHRVRRDLCLRINESPAFRVRWKRIQRLSEELCSPVVLVTYQSMRTTKTDITVEIEVRIQSVCSS